MPLICKILKTKYILYHAEHDVFYIGGSLFGEPQWKTDDTFAVTWNTVDAAHQSINQIIAKQSRINNNDNCVKITPEKLIIIQRKVKYIYTRA